MLKFIKTFLKIVIQITLLLLVIGIEYYINHFTKNTYQIYITIISIFLLIKWFFFNESKKNIPILFWNNIYINSSDLFIF